MIGALLVAWALTAHGADTPEEPWPAGRVTLSGQVGEYQTQSQHRQLAGGLEAAWFPGKSVGIEVAGVISRNRGASDVTGLGLVLADRAFNAGSGEMSPMRAQRHVASATAGVTVVPLRARLAAVSFGLHADLSLSAGVSLAAVRVAHISYVPNQYDPADFLEVAEGEGSLQPGAMAGMGTDLYLSSRVAFVLSARGILVSQASFFPSGQGERAPVLQTFRTVAFKMVLGGTP